MPQRAADITPSHPRRATSVLAVSLLVAALISLPGRASEASTAGERAFNRRPQAKAGLAIAHAYLRAGRHAKAVNWASRAANCSDATVATRAEAARLERKLRWLLYDQGFGVVEVRLEPSHATVTVDGQLFAPATHLVRMWLPNGSHQLEVRKARFHTVRRIITAKAGERRRINVKLAYAVPPEARFVVQPPNAEVWLGQDFLGLAAKPKFALPVGKSLIEVRAQGYVSWVRTIEMKPGERRTWKISLAKSSGPGRSRPSASNVRRRLTPLELANRGERHRLGKRPGTGRAHRRTYRGSGQAPDAAPKTDRPNWRKVAKAGSRAPDMDEPPPSPEDMGGSDLSGEDEGGAGGVDAGVSGTTLSDATKGWLYTGIGVALMAGGVGTSIYGVAQAKYANGLSLGHSRYDAYYDNAANMTYAGYGSAGVGLLSMAVGGLYLFSEDGLSEAGRGMFLMGVGAVTSVAGAWLIVNAVATAEAANSLPIRHYSYATSFDGAEANWRVGAIATGVGGVVILAGAWLFFTGDSADTASAAPSSWFATVTPTYSPGHAGASVTFAW